MDRLALQEKASKLYGPPSSPNRQGFKIVLNALSSGSIFMYMTPLDLYNSIIFTSSFIVFQREVSMQLRNV